MATELERLALFELQARYMHPGDLVLWAVLMTGADGWSPPMADKFAVLCRWVVLITLREGDEKELDSLARALNRLRHPITGVPAAIRPALAEQRLLCAERARQLRFAASNVQT